MMMVNRVIKRTFYYPPDNSIYRGFDEPVHLPAPYKKIKGIALTDMDDGPLVPVQSEGGIGFSYVNIQIVVRNGKGWNYTLEVFA